jgi:hypothetical protein
MIRWFAYTLFYCPADLRVSETIREVGGRNCDRGSRSDCPDRPCLPQYLVEDGEFTTNRAVMQKDKCKPPLIGRQQPLARVAVSAEWRGRGARGCPRAISPGGQIGSIYLGPIYVGLLFALMVPQLRQRLAGILHPYRRVRQQLVVFKTASCQACCRLFSILLRASCSSTVSSNQRRIMSATSFL